MTASNEPTEKELNWLLFGLGLFTRTRLFVVTLVTFPNDVLALNMSLKIKSVITFRFVPFPLAAPLPFPLDDSSSFLGDLGFTEKNPSRRPCCLALRNLDNFSAPFFPRSSLSKQNRHHQRSPIYRVMIIGVLEAFFGHQELYETVNIWVLPLQLQSLLRSHSR